MTAYGPQPSYTPAPRPGVPAGQPVPVFDLIGIVLGILSFIWGFLAWYGTSGDSFTYKGFATTGAGAIGLSVLAAAAAGFELLDREKRAAVVPAAAAIAALLVTVGLFVGKPSGEDAKVGLILELVTTLFQAAIFVLGFLQVKGKIMQPRHTTPPAWGVAPYNYTNQADLPSQPLPQWGQSYPGGATPQRPPYQGYPSPAPGYPPAPAAQPGYPSAAPSPYPPGSGPQAPRPPYPPPAGSPPPGQPGYQPPYPS